jgi:hypothetical protein
MESSNISRRKFLMKASIAGGSLAAVNLSCSHTANGGRKLIAKSANSFDYRIAYGCWVNDMRLEPLPLVEWPADLVDDETVKSVIKTMDLQSNITIIVLMHGVY